MILIKICYQNKIICNQHNIISVYLCIHIKIARNDINDEHSKILSQIYNILTYIYYNIIILY